jgi:hypothetical protein
MTLLQRKRCLVGGAGALLRLMRLLLPTHPYFSGLEKRDGALRRALQADPPAFSS